MNNQIGFFDEPAEALPDPKRFGEPMRFGSVCSGIEAASVAWEPLGFEADWLSQFDPEHDYKKGPDFPSSVLEYRWPKTPNLGDMTAIKDKILSGEVAAPPVFVGWTPCQAFSLAGLRKGMGDDRGQLSIEFIKIADAIDEKRKGDECVILWENVPGVLSDKENAFGCFLAGLVGESQPLKSPRDGWSNAGCVFGPKRSAAWRILDAQYFGVAQRRRRLFVVASARDWFDPTKILFEREGVRRDSPPSREARSAVAALTARGVGTCGADDNQAQAGHLIKGFRMSAFGEYQDDQKASTLKQRDYKDDTDLICFESRQEMSIYGDVAGTLDCQRPVGNAVAFAENSRAELRLCGGNGDISGTLSTGGGKPGQGLPCIAGSGVRRLTPVECERLQGFPDNFTKIPWRGKSPEDCPGSHRYKALGNSMAVPVMRWIGQRIKNYLF